MSIEKLNPAFELFSPQMVIIGCLVLNNMALMFGDPEFAKETVPGAPEEDGVDDLGPELPDPSEAVARAAGEAYRESLLRFFQA